MPKFNIFHRKDGRWEGRIPIGKNKNGNRHFKHFLGRTKEQVREKMIEFRCKAVKVVSDDNTLSKLYTEWYQGLIHRVKESTVANYETKANKHILPEFGNKSISNITINDIYAFIDKKQEEGLSHRYIQDIIIVMKSIFKYGVKVYKIDNPIEYVTIGKRKSSEIDLLLGTRSDYRRHGVS